METLDNRSTAIRNWQSILNDLRLENSRLKDLLAEAVRNDLYSDFLEQAEYYQQKFIEKDQIMELLRHDISILSKVLTRGAPNHTDKAQYELLRKDIGKFIAEFEQMARSFFDFLLLNKKRSF